MRKKWTKKLFAGIVAMSLVLQGTVSDGSLIMAKAENGTKQSKVLTKEEKEIQKLRESDVEITDPNLPVIVEEVVQEEQGEEQEQEQEQEQEEEQPEVTTGPSLSVSIPAKQKDATELMLVLDVSGSMGGEPMENMKKSCYYFIDDFLAAYPNGKIGITTYESSVHTYTFEGEYFSNDRMELRDAVDGLDAGGGTGMHAGLQNADRVLTKYGQAETQLIMQMADGMPNTGYACYSEDARYEDAPYESGVYEYFDSIQTEYGIYSLGFFHSLYGDEREFADRFMKDIQNMGYYSVSDPDQLSISFEQIVEDISTESVYLNKNNLFLNKGQEEQLKVQFTDSYTSDNKEISWTSSDPKIASVDESGMVTALDNGECQIVAQVGEYKLSCFVSVGKENTKDHSYVIRVLQNEKEQFQSETKYVAAEDAMITFNGTEYSTDSDGVVLIPKFETGEITIKKKNYAERVVTKEQLDITTTIYLEKITENPTINAVWVNNVDIIHDTENSITIDNEDTTNMLADVYWGEGKESGQVYLTQTTVLEPFEGNRLSMVLSSKFDLTDTIYVYAKAKDDRRTKMPLMISRATTKAVEELSGLKLSMGDSTSITLPDDFPIIGGGEFEVDFGNVPYPITYEIKDGKVTGTIGLTASSLLESEEKKSKDIKNFHDVVKAAGEKMKNAADTTEFKKGIDQLKTLKSTYSDLRKAAPKGSFGIEADMTLMGEFDGYIDKDGKFHLTDGCIIVNPEGSVEWSKQIFIAQIPCYVEAEISLSVAATLGLSKGSEKDTLAANGELKGNLDGSLGGGVGINKVATIGGGGTLGVEVGTRRTIGQERYDWIEVGLNAYFKAKLGPFTYKKDFEGIKKKFDNSEKGTKEKNNNSINYAAEFNDESKYKIESLKYIKAETVTESAVVTEDAVQEGGTQKHVFHANAYGETEPCLVELGDGTKMAVWIDTKEADVNAVQVYYSCYENGTWSEEKVVDADGTADFGVKATVVDGKVYVIWQNVSDAITEETTPEELAEMVGIKVGVYNALEDTFEVTQLAGVDKKICMHPVIAGDDGNIVAAWVENEDNSWFGEGNKNTIYTSTFEDGAWTEKHAEENMTNLNAVTGIALDCDGTEINLAYTMDEDGDSSTADDWELYVNGEKQTNNTCVDSNPVFAGHKLYWFQDVAIMEAKNSTTVSGAAVVTGSSFATGDRFSVIDSKYGKAILFTKADGYGSQVYASIYQEDTETYSEAVSVTNTDGNISTFSALWEKEGITTLCNTVEVFETSEEKYGATNLELHTYGRKADLELTECVYDPDEIVVDSTVPIYVSVKNNGLETLDGVTVEIVGEEGEVVDSVEYGMDLLTGSENDLVIQHQVQAEEVGKTYSILVKPRTEGIEHSVVTGGSITLDYTDLAISHLLSGKLTDETAYVSAYITNEGYTETGTTTVCLYKDSLDSAPLQELEVEGLRSMESGKVIFQVPFEEDAVYYVKLGEVVGDEDLSNNQEFVVIRDIDHVTGNVLQSITAEKENVYYQIGDPLAVNDIKAVGVFEDGHEMDLTKYINVDSSMVDMNQEGTYQLKVSAFGQSTTITIYVEGFTDVSLAEPTPEVTAAPTEAPTEVPTPAVTEVPTPSAVVPTPVVDTSVNNESAVSEETPTYKVGKCTYEKNEKGVTLSSVDKSWKKKAKLVIPNTVKIDGKKYKVTEIGEKVFKNSQKLVKVKLGNNISVIQKQAFADCKKLKTVEFGKSVTTIKANTFKGCSKLKQITISSKSVKTVEKGAFKGIANNAAFIVPKAKVKAYSKVLKDKSLGYKKWKVKGK